MIREYLESLRGKLFGLSLRMKDDNIGGKPIRTVLGTVRATTDSDDAWFANLVRDKKVVFDIGANVGYTALLSKCYGAPDELILVDPNPLALSTAATNLILNNLGGNCRFITAFVSGESKGRVKFFTLGRGAAGSIYSFHAKSASDRNSFQWVPTTTIDEIVRTQKIIPDLIKVDVEGAEGDVLNGSREVAAERKAIFFVEMHSNAELTMKANTERVLQWCNEVQYEAWYLKEGVPLLGAVQIEHRGRCHLLLQPAGTQYPDCVKGVKQGAPLPPILSPNPS